MGMYGKWRKKLVILLFTRRDDDHRCCGDNALFSELVILHKCLLRMLLAILLTAEL
jgi:hypothetical protein